MATGKDGPARWTTWTIKVKVWKLFAVTAVLAILVMWFKVVHQSDEILALIRNEVAMTDASQRIWTGSFVNTNGRTLRDVAVTIDLLDSQNRTVGKARAEVAELPYRARLDLQAPLPGDAVRMRVYSVQWRMDRTAVDRWLRRAPDAALMGPFREPWEFGYVMANAGSFEAP